MLRLLPGFGSNKPISPTVDTSSERSKSSGDNISVGNCRCCGTLVKFPDSVKKYKCSICKSTITLFGTGSYTETNIAPTGFNPIKHKIKQCQSSAKHGMSHHEVYSPLEQYIAAQFSSIETLNKSFLLLRSTPELTKGFNINYREIEDTFRLLTSLPTIRPYYKLLITVNQLLRRAPIQIPEGYGLRWLLILFEIPTLPDCLYHERKPRDTSNTQLDTPEIKSLSYEIIKRLIGYIANSSARSLELLANWLTSLPQAIFEYKVQLLNLYITFHLTRIINRTQDQKKESDIISSSRSKKPNSPDINEYTNSEKLNIRASSQVRSTRSSPFNTSIRRAVLQLPGSFQSGFSSWSDRHGFDSVLFPYDRKNHSEVKLKTSMYGNEWHIKTAARLLSLFFVSNINKLPIYSFYNSLVDYVQVKQDFDTWQNAFKKTDVNDPNRIIYELLQTSCIANSSINSGAPQFTFCQYPFLLSLGAKISILEYEARRTMEREAEEAFIKALDNKKVMDINLRIQVRRTHIANDSIRCIKNNRGDLRKALRVEFVGEPGIDVGGLKKEWFQLLSKELFSQEAGMFHYNDESHLCWFAPMPMERNDELYFMVGVVLGLAIYNSTILDLRFPLVLYKKLLDKKVTLDDYIELFPTTGEGLRKLLKTNEDVSSYHLVFETEFKDFFDKVQVRELIPGGSKVPVTNSNRKEYVQNWIEFYLNKVIEPQFKSFYKGFHLVIGCNALSLFAPKEIEMIICGNNDSKIETESLKVITKYNGWVDSQAALNSELVQWFWEWFSNLQSKEQKKFLSFVTGSDRIPATGVSTMNFKITKLTQLEKHKAKKLPVAHTCFNELCLYDYESKAELFRKMSISINESQGFGLK